MQKLRGVLTCLLIISSIALSLDPVTEVRYNTYNKNVDCYNENKRFLPEGCAASIKKTEVQTIAHYITVVSLLGIISLSLFILGQSHFSEKSNERKN